MSGRPRGGAQSDRLVTLRESWPSRVSWAEVRAAQPTVFRQAALGALLCIPAAVCTVVWLALTFEWPRPIALPGWIAWAHGFLIVIALFASILLWMWGLIMVSMPADTRRGLAFELFAKHEGMGYMRMGFPPARLGVFFAEKLPGPRDPARRRLPAGAARPASLFRSTFVLWRGRDASDPELAIGIASYTGGKNDPKGPRHGFRYLSLRLPRALPHLIIDARGNGSLRTLLPGTQRLSLEGDFDRYFTTYVPEGYERDALELLTPDVMACLIDYGSRWDIEVIDDRLQLASSRVTARSDAAESTALVCFAELVGAELAHQAASYSDPRASRPRAQVAAQGRRLRRRSTAWTTAAFVGIIGAMLAFPHMLGWLLDR